MRTMLILIAVMLRGSVGHPVLALGVLIVAGTLAAPFMGSATDTFWRLLVLIGVLLVASRLLGGGGRRRR